MNFTDIIAKKRDGYELNKDELIYFANGAAKNTIPDYQLSALLMAICINGMSERETTELTYAMVNSGDVLDLADIKGIKIDKHSTGGVGDTTTLILAPLTASLGLPVVKMSGRGLGHTGGTLDKLESIPNFNINIDNSKAVDQVNKNGIVIMGQTALLAPADKTLYALRDVTATVESIPLIASSIMSKKIAGGADGIVLDVKVGNGAFMKSKDDAIKLCDSMITIGKNLGKKMCGLITDMNEPLGMYIGNSLEVIEAIEVLKGKRNGRLKEVALALGAEMLVMGEIAKDIDTAYDMLNKNIENGKGLEKFVEVINLQNGDPNVVYDYSIFDQPKETAYLCAENSGYIESINAFEIGRASLETGAGREKKSDDIDPSAGIIMHKRVGDYVEKGEKLADVFSSSVSKCENAINIIKNAIKIGENKVETHTVYEIRR